MSTRTYETAGAFKHFRSVESLFKKLCFSKVSFQKVAFSIIGYLRTGGQSEKEKDAFSSEHGYVKRLEIVKLKKLLNTFEVVRETSTC